MQLSVSGALGGNKTPGKSPSNAGQGHHVKWSCGYKLKGQQSRNMSIILISIHVPISLISRNIQNQRHKDKPSTSSDQQHIIKYHWLPNIWVVFLYMDAHVKFSLIGWDDA